MKKLFVLGFFLLALATPAYAVNPDEVLADPALEARARDLSGQLRCMVCQNQSIDLSDAPLARDLRLLVRERLAAGDSDEAIIDYLVARYGDFVLLKPRFSAHNLVLWLAPFGVLAIAGAIIVSRTRRRAAPSGTAPLNEEELARLDQLLKD